MGELASPIILIILLFMLSFLIPYNLARQRTKDYKLRKRKFNALSKNLLRLKENVSTETDRWPMYARPVLFTEIDHKAQIEFAKAQQALNDADEIVPEIQTIEEPETPEEFRFNELFNIPKNFKTISIGNQFAGGVNALEREIQNLTNSVRSLRTNRREVEKTRLDVERAIEELRKRTEQVNKRLQSLDVWKSIEAHDFSWVVSIADRCQLEAYNSIENVSENEQGNIEHATADVFVDIGNFSLDSIELFLESQKISRRYELDTFFTLFKGSTGFLQSILEMEDVWSGWRKLKRVKPEIDKLPQAKQQAEKSLRSFKNRQEYLSRLIDLLSAIDIEKEISDAGNLEEECIAYWYSHTERKNYWEKALGVPLKLPSTELSHFQTLLVTEINPEIDVDTVIKQSQMLGLIKKIGDALEEHMTITRLSIRLREELNVHQEAQRIVIELLGPQGDASLILAQLQMAIEDTSPDIRDAGNKLVADHQNYLKRKKEIQGADFPQLVKSLEHFITDSERLVRKHRSELERLSTTYDTYYESIDLLNKDLETYINHIPKFDDRSIKLFNEAVEESRSILDEEKVEWYSWLRPSVDQMQTWLDRTSSFANPARDKYRAFETAKRQVEKLLEETQEELENNKEKLDSRWAWYKTEIMPRINASARSFNKEQKEWNRLIERNWSDYNLKRAQSTCDNLITFCENLLVGLNQAIERVNQKQHQLNGKFNAINDLLQINAPKLSSQDKKDIKSLMTFAVRDTSYDSANRLLGYAHTLAMRKANSSIRDQVTNIINVYSQGGSVFFDKVHNEGNIYGALNIEKYFRQKGRKRNEKKR